MFYWVSKFSPNLHPFKTCQEVSASNWALKTITVFCYTLLVGDLSLWYETVSSQLSQFGVSPGHLHLTWSDEDMVAAPIYILMKDFISLSSLRRWNYNSLNIMSENIHTSFIITGDMQQHYFIFCLLYVFPAFVPAGLRSRHAESKWKLNDLRAPKGTISLERAAETRERDAWFWLDRAQQQMS